MIVPSSATRIATRGNWIDRLSVQNAGAGYVLVLLGGHPVSAGSFTKRIEPGEYWEIRNYRGEASILRVGAGPATVQKTGHGGEILPFEDVPAEVVDILSVQITPDGDTVDQVTDIATFSAAVTGTINGEASAVPQDVIWSVNGVDGGNAELGIVNGSGQYTAPDSLDRLSSVTLRARSAVDPSVFDEVTVSTPAFDLFVVDQFSDRYSPGIGDGLQVGYRGDPAPTEGSSINAFTTNGALGQTHPMVCRLHGTDCVATLGGKVCCRSTADTGDRHVFRSFREGDWGTSGFLYPVANLLTAAGSPISVYLQFDPAGVAPTVGSGRKVLRIASSFAIEQFPSAESYTPDSISTWAPFGAVLPELDPRFQSFRTFPLSNTTGGGLITNTDRGDATRWYAGVYPNGNTQKDTGYVYVYGGNRFGNAFDGGGMGGGRYIVPHVAAGGAVARSRVRIVDLDSKFDSNVRFMWVIRRPVSVSSGLGHTDSSGGGREIFAWNDISVTLATSGGGFELRIGGTLVGTSDGAIPGGPGDLVQFDVEVLYGNPSGSVFAAASLINDAGTSGSGTVSAQFTGPLGQYLRSGWDEPLMFTPPASVDAVAQGGWLNSYYQIEGFVRLCRVAKFYPAGGKSAQPVVVFVSPASATVNVNATLAHTAKVSGTENQAVTWSVLGGAANGTIDSNGIYTAPAVEPVGLVTVRATSVANPSSHTDVTIDVFTPPPFQELDATPDLEAWFAADRITGVFDGDGLATWEDAQNSHDVSQGTAGLRPVYKTGIANGLPVVRFSAGSSQRLTGSDAGMPTGDYTIIVVAKMSPLALNTNRGIFGYGSNAVGQLATVGCGRGAGYGDTNSRYWFSQYGDAGPIGAIGGDLGGIFTVFAVTRTGTSYEFWMNTKNKRTKTMTSGPVLGGTMTIGSFIDQTAFFDGDVAEIGVYARKLSVAEVESILDSMATKYGITLLLT